MRLSQIFAILAALAIHAPAASVADEAARKELAPTGKLRVGVAVAPAPGAGNVQMVDGRARGIGGDLGFELAKTLGVPVEWVQYANSGALTDGAAAGAWDVAFIPVDAQRKQKVDFGAAHLVLQSTFLVGPKSAAQSHADLDRAGMRIVGVENTATARAAQAMLKNAKMSHEKKPDELLAMLRDDKIDAIALSRESLIQMSAKLPGSRVLPGAYLNSYVAVAVPKGRSAGLAYASAFVEDMKTSGMVRRSLDSVGMTESVVAPPGVKP
jgi:polar amino acid transport system substrate-binding protein